MVGIVLTEQPITPSEFAAAMDRLGPFEPNPRLAVAISGGGDSMALLHLAAEWAAAHTGTVLAITIDHAIRQESADEAVQVGKWAAKLNVEHITVKWSEPQAEDSALQQRARQARYRLLSQVAAQRGIIHLAVAHHADDQAETVLLRLAKGSGPDGLAGMSAIVPLPHLRILRPLLGFTHDRLLATCKERGQEWIEDPSNHSSRYARPRLRAAKELLAAEGLTTETLTATAKACARARAFFERATADVLARHATIFPQGYAEIALPGWGGEDEELRRRSLATLLQKIGGDAYPPDANAVAEMIDTIPTRATLAGCLIETVPTAHKINPLPHRGRGQGEGAMPLTLTPTLSLNEGEGVVKSPIRAGDITSGTLRISRENRHLPPEIFLAAGIWQEWDRFKILAPHDCTVSAVADDLPKNFATTLPKRVIVTQPAFRKAGKLVAIPTLGYGDDTGFQALFSPSRAAGESEFAIV